jgi:hypothetical protein
VGNKATFVMDEEKLIILVQGRECLYNLQHNDYDNSLVKDNCWKEIAGEWQGSGRVMAGERHGICESALSHCRCPDRRGLGCETEGAGKCRRNVWRGEGGTVNDRWLLQADFSRVL